MFMLQDQPTPRVGSSRVQGGPLLVRNGVITIAPLNDVINR